MSNDSRRQLRAHVETLLDVMYPPGAVITHSPECDETGERCLAHAVLRVFHIDHADSVCDDVTRIVRYWLITRKVPVP